ncbi:MAG: hypothetical protein H7249_00610 [Chitinophagaceae bacterium]|nr:hypothetical protein [Oligoflexus sp.]
MGKIIEFKTKEVAREETVVNKLVQMANEIDYVMMNYLTDPDVDARELVGVLSHRLGALMSHLEEKDELWHVCQAVLKKQAKIVD